MKKELLIALIAVCLAAQVAAAPKKYRQRMTFDREWSFRLCKDYVEAKGVLTALGVEDNRIGEIAKKAEKTKVTHDTEPEQAQVTAGEVTSAKVKWMFPMTGASNCLLTLRWVARLAISQEGRAYIIRTSYCRHRREARRGSV